MRTIGILLLFFQLLTSSHSYAQDKTADSTWQKVEIRVIESINTSKELNVLGESLLNIKKQINTPSDLNEKQMMELKKRAAKDGAKMVYIDTKGLYDSPPFPTMYSRGKLYYYWANEK